MTGITGATCDGARLLRVQRVEATFSPLPFDVEAARQYGIIAAEVIAMGRRPSGRVADLMIAGIAAAKKLPLFTTNPADSAGLNRPLLSSQFLSRRPLPEQRIAEFRLHLESPAAGGRCGLSRPAS